MIPQLAIALAILLAGFGSGWTVQGWKMATQLTQVKLEAQKEKADGLQKALDQTATWKKEYDDAIKEAKSRVVRNGALAAAARAESDRLRDQLANTNARLATAPVDAVRRYATTASAVLDECQREYQGMAEKADGHAADTLKLQQAWPK